MLVITRRKDESLLIGDDIEIKIVKVEDGRVRLAISAPREITILRKEVFEKWGGYDERLTRNQDNEMNYRIRKNGGKVYLSSDIKLSYYCRDSVKGISNMALKNGMWNVITMKLCPGSMGLRHFIPLMFLLSIIVLPILSIFVHLFALLFAIEMCLYLLLDCYFSAKQADGIKEFLLLLILFPIFHITYGAGSLKGLLKLFSKKYR